MFTERDAPKMSRRFSLLMVLFMVAALALPAAVTAQVVVTDGPQSTTGAPIHTASS
jgi:hypothetical protein